MSSTPAGRSQREEVKHLRAEKGKDCAAYLRRHALSPIRASKEGKVRVPGR